MQSNRNKTEKGPGGWMCTSLNAACAYNLNRLAKIKPGDFVLDPMAGLGTIPIGTAMPLSIFTPQREQLLTHVHTSWLATTICRHSKELEQI